MRPWESGPGSMEARVASPVSSDHGHGLLPSPRPRVANACDVCKRRKVKCNGATPCGYCVSRKHPSLCLYSPPRQRRARVRASRLTGVQEGGEQGGQEGYQEPYEADGDGGGAHSAVSPQPSCSSRGGHAVVHPAPAASTSQARASSRSSNSNSSKETPPVVTKESEIPSRRSLPGEVTGGSVVGNVGRSQPQSQSQSRQGQHQETQPEQEGQQKEQEQPPREPGPGTEAHNEETEVPREGRLLVDPQGKLIFIGDCAPLSFFRTVQRLITSRIDPDAFAPENSGYSALENNNAAYYPKASGAAAAAGVFPGGGGYGGGGGRGYGGDGGRGPPLVQTSIIESAVTAYFQSTAGLIDIFDDQAQQPRQLIEDITSWAVQLGRSRPFMETGGVPPGGDATSAVFYLVLAIGLLFQKTITNKSSSSPRSEPSGVPESSFPESESIAQAYFDHARDLAFANLSGNLGLASVQSFLLITLYMLGACQINGAFIFFGIAARSAFSIGIHRTEVNARFNPEIHRQRDRLWKSLRVVDLFLSTSMGRPPATSDVDCTVLYHAVDGEGREQTDPDFSGDYLLNGSAQIFLIIEGIVLEVYSRRKISPQLTEGISRELREWSARWLQRLKRVIDEERPRPSPRQTPLLTTVAGSEAMVVNGACQVLASYYYAVILVSRPFLMVELRRRLAEGYPAEASTARDGLVTSGKSKLADACIDAASLMVDPIQDLIERGLMARRAPVIVSWLFASSLVLGLGLLGGFGRIIEKYCRASIAALEYFAEADAHAVQYSLIAKSLLNTALVYLEKREMQDRLRRTESSSQLFGLIPRRNSRDNTTDDNHNNNNNITNGHENLRDTSPTSHPHQYDQQSHYQRSIQHTNPSVGGQFGGIPGSLRGDGSTHRHQQQPPPPKPSSYHIGTHHNSHNHHNYLLHHHHHHPHAHAHAHAHTHTPSSTVFSPVVSRFNSNHNNMNHHFDFFGGHESTSTTATTFLGLTESLPRTPEFSIMGGSLDSDADQTFGALNLFPLLETDGHIDLANYF
ncbi:hypothetical protein GE21DRAFT_10508 [Neurospora crassa]|uniref:TAH-2 n=1 Tax=Neurospora crassa (strain ATCC 24698 / 74-OR23-1A / CBS 708.71 / DSM 1257 / FGSC 987) TaxID=367110 RepID=Q7S3X5_NEUCR|nr:TAH-2 [Neurospora crassa OR74A]EAA30193.2 TAH-2 [Neurospora crassa OR74A]KHE84076.1 hypothetical protein GE21DRAFT_10508 [Neurospora crassa]|eukprot:XP_959429.2 TAH-2 [Neurospora crassa OR74A]